jgi:Kef-type K+ transport system membrane component KefB
MLMQCGLVLVISTIAFIALARFIPFTHDLTPLAVAGVALLWGTFAITRSPSAVLGILTQLKPKGPLTSFSVGFVMASNIVVVVVFALTLALVRVMVAGGGSVGMAEISALGHELLGSVALGTTLGLILILFFRFYGKQVLVVLVALGFGLTELLQYIHLDPLLAFMVAGFVIQNFSQQGGKVLHAVEEAGAVVFVVFFATAGAHLDLPLLFALWPVALSLAAIRAFATMAAMRASARLADDPPVLRNWGWSGMVAQAGLTIGFSVVVARAFPEFGEGFRSLAVGVVTINEVIGPILFKLGLDRTGESGAGREAAPSGGATPSATA